MANKNLSKQALDYLCEREGGIKLTVFDDQFGYPTVGLGHLVMDVDDLTLGDRITKGMAYKFLYDDLEWACDAVNKFVHVDLAQHQFDALVIFCFNIGYNGFKKSTLVRRLNNKEDMSTVVGHEMKRWNKIHGNFVPGLQNRRIDTAQMFITGDYSVDWSGLDGQV